MPGQRDSCEARSEQDHLANRLDARPSVLFAAAGLWQIDDRYSRVLLSRRGRAPVRYCGDHAGCRAPTLDVIEHRCLTASGRLLVPDGCNLVSIAERWPHLAVPK